MLRTSAVFTAACLCTIAARAAVSAPALHDKLARIVHSDSEAAALFSDLRKQADDALHDAPNPIKTIVSEGHLGSDPDRIRTYQSLPDIDKINALHYAWVVTLDEKYFTKLREFLLAWASVNVSQGNPINDTKLEPLIYAYADARKSLSPDDRRVINRWCSTMAHALIDAMAQRPDTLVINWQSHRLKMIGLVAFLLHDDQLTSFAIDGYRKQLRDNLRPDGASIDFEVRDALHYHCYDLEPLLSLAIAADQHGIDLYHEQSPAGASLPKSVAFLLPFCDGSKPHPEFVHSTVDFDRQRAASGDRMYQAGRAFDPHMATHTLELAAYFDPSLVPLLARITHASHPRYPTWQIVLNDTLRKNAN
ncbi:MAG: alginate lyase family protein [Phycisphaerae bacterium]